MLNQEARIPSSSCAAFASRKRHRPRIQVVVDVGLRDFLAGVVGGADDGFVGELADGFALFKGLFGEGGGFVVADHGDEAGTHGEGTFDEALASLFIGLEVFEEVLVEHAAAAGQKVDGVEGVVGHHGHGDVEVEEGADAAEAAEGGGGVVA